MWQWMPIFRAQRYLLSYAAGERGAERHRVGAARFNGQSLSDLEVIYAVPRTSREPSISASRAALASRRQPAGVDRDGGNVRRCNFEVR